MSRLYFLLFLWIFVNPSAGQKVDDYKLQDMLKTDKIVKIPSVIHRLYQQWSSKPKYEAKMIQSIPAQVTETEDGVLLMTSLIPQTRNTTVRKAELWIEVHDIKERAKVCQTYYAVDIRPASDAFECFIHVTKKPRLHDTHLELNFNITYLYMNCREADTKYFQLKLQFSVQSAETPDETLKTGKLDAFIILQEVYWGDLHYFVNVAPPKVQNNKSFQPLDNALYTRSKRMAVPRRRSKRVCGLHHWYVAFADMGWNWVIAPLRGFVANRCRGRCSFPLTDNMNTTNHAVVQTMMNSMHGKPRSACCTPKNFTSLTMIFQEDDNILTLKKYPDMVVSSCACL